MTGTAIRTNPFTIRGPLFHQSGRARKGASLHAAYSVVRCARVVGLRVWEFSYSLCRIDYRQSTDKPIEFAPLSRKRQREHISSAISERDRNTPHRQSRRRHSCDRHGRHFVPLLVSGGCLSLESDLVLNHREGGLSDVHIALTFTQYYSGHIPSLSNLLWPYGESMPISFGFPCQTCGTLHLINRTFDRARVTPLSRSDCMYLMPCTGCRATICFSKEDLRAYTVSNLGFAIGHVRRGQYTAATVSSNQLSQTRQSGEI